MIFICLLFLVINQLEEKNYQLKTRNQELEIEKDSLEMRLEDQINDMNEQQAKVINFPSKNVIHSEGSEGEGRTPVSVASYTRSARVLVKSNF